MSAMELFRSRVAESAKAAAGAARQLSSLDDMAQNDDYVQSEGLRISEKKDTSAAPSFSDNSPSVVEDLSVRFVDALSTAARKQTRPRPADQNPATAPQQIMSRPSTTHQQKSGPRENAKPSKSVSQKPKPETQKTKLISSVAELYDAGDKKRHMQQHLAAKNNVPKQQLQQRQNHKSKIAEAKEREGKSSTSKSDQSQLSLATVPTSPGQKNKVLLVNDHAHIFHELDYDSDTSSDDEQPGQSQLSSDIEMGRMGNVALHDQLEQELEESISRQNSQAPSEAQQKDVHRFMKMTADLESERESLLGSTPTNAGSVASPWAQGTRGGSAGEETNKALQAGLSWMRNVASPQLETFSKQIMSAVSEADFRTPEERQRRGPMIGPRHAPSPKNQEGEETITMTSSAAFLADEDMAELERIRLRNSTSKVRELVQQCIDNPRLAFIAVTLVFALFAYFYSRHRSVDDVL